MQQKNRGTLLEKRNNKRLYTYIYIYIYNFALPGKLWRSGNIESNCIIETCKVNIDYIMVTFYIQKRFYRIFELFINKN